MRELLIHRGPRVESIVLRAAPSCLCTAEVYEHANSSRNAVYSQQIDSPIPSPGVGEVTIKVHAVAMNPKDWKMSEWFEGRAMNEGEDIAGTVHAIGDHVFGFAIGDRVAAYHTNSSPNGGYAEYAVALAEVVVQIGSAVSFEEASTVPLCGITASWAIIRTLALPSPWSPAGPLSQHLPLVINGGSTCVGSFAIKLAVLGNIHPIITTAGAAKSYVETLLDASKGDVCIDYRCEEEKLVVAVRAALKGSPALHAIETVGDESCLKWVRQVIAPGGHIGITLPMPESDVSGDEARTELIQSTGVYDSPFGLAQRSGKDFGHVMMQYFGRALRNGTFTGHPYKLVPGGLEGAEEALRDMKAGKASATKFVIRVC